MFLLLIVASGFYLYKTGDLQKLLNQFQPQGGNRHSEARGIIDVRYAAGEISTEEYNKLKHLL